MEGDRVGTYACKYCGRFAYSRYPKGADRRNRFAMVVVVNHTYYCELLQYKISRGYKEPVADEYKAA